MAVERYSCWDLWQQACGWYRQVQDLDEAERLFELSLLWEKVFGTRPLSLRQQEEESVAPEQARRLAEMVRRRSQGYPLQYLLGSWEFYGREFLVGEGVLIPRPDTECLIEVVQARCKDPQIVVDLCSGSGCIAITLAHLYPQAQVYGVEQSPEALDYFQRNVALHRLQDRVTVIQGDARVPLDLPLVDLLVSNPPYVSEVEMAHLQREVQFEPAMALQAPEEGLHFYRCFLERCPVPLAPQALVAFEIGWRQGQAVEELFRRNGYRQVEVLQDYGGRDRVVLGRRDSDPLK